MTEPSDLDRTGGEIDWPAHIERTPPAERKRTHKYRVSFSEAVDDIDTELSDRLGADSWRLSTAAPHRKRDGLPYADANIDDPGAVVRWRKDGDQFCVAADNWTTLRDNVRTIGLYIAEKRKMAGRPVRTAQDEFASARLPPGDDEEAIVAGNGLERDAHAVLGVAPDAPDAVVKGAYRELLKERHPDHGGTQAEFTELNRAKEEILNSDTPGRSP